MSTTANSSTTTPKTDTKPERKEIEGNSIRVSAQRSIKLYADIALRMMVKHETVELHGLGAAVSMTADISQHLIHLKKATIKKVSTSSLSTTSKGVTGSQKPELTIILNRTGIPTVPEPLTDEQQQLASLVDDDDH